MSTVDRFAGVITLSIAPGCEEEVSALMHSLEGEMHMEAVAPGDGALFA